MHCAVFIVVSYPANGETFVGTAAATGTHKRPLLVVDGKRFELEASDKSDTSVAGMLARFSQGDSGTYTVTGTQSAINNHDGILIDTITPSSIGHLVSPNTLSAAGNGPNALSQFSNAQLIILGVLVLGVCVTLCILTGVVGYWWHHSKSRNEQRAGWGKRR